MAKARNNLPVSVEELERALVPHMKESAQALANAEPVYSTQNIIRVKNKKFSFGDETLPAPLRVVVLGSAFAQMYYDAEYDPDNRTPPVCFALANTENELAPHETAPDKQSELCMNCPQNKPGSHPKGGWMRACAGRRRLAILLVSDRSPDPQIGSIELSASALKAWTQYVKGLAGVHNMPIHAVVTELNFVDTKKDTWYVGAAFGGRLTQERPEWLMPPKGVKVGSEGWYDQTIIGRKVKEVYESKMLLVPPSLVAPEAPKKKKPVTGAARMSVKDAKNARKARGKK